MNHQSVRPTTQLNSTLNAGAMLLLIAAISSSGAFAQRGVQVNTDSNGQDILGDAANEPTLAVNPIDPRVMVIGWREFPTIQSDSRFAGYAWSIDGGETWTNGGVLDPPPNQPPDAEQSDPVITVDSNGVFYYWSEVFRPNPPTTHYVYQSMDGGVTWPIVHQVEDPPTPGDKEWMAIDRTGGIGDGLIHGGWNNFTLGGHCYVRSIDGGQTFSDPVRIADLDGTQWMIQFTVGNDGEVYAAWRNSSRAVIFITKSTNANDPAQIPVFDAFGSGGENGQDVRVAPANNPSFVAINPSGFHQIYLDVDRSDGPLRDNVYLLWADDRNDVCDIYFARSEDGGFSWEPQARVNDDPLGSGAYQWMPAMTVAPNGRIDAVWYDTRNDGGGLPASELWYSFSIDGGVSWSPNRRLSVAFSTVKGYPQQSKIGDYITCASDEAGVNIAYSATFTGGQDVYFLRANPFLLDVPPLTAGQPVTITVTNARPQSRTWLAYSLAGRGDTAINAIDVTLGILNPVQVGSPRFTNVNGAVAWNLSVPDGASGMTVWAQAVQFGAASNVVERTVK